MDTFVVLFVEERNFDTSGDTTGAPTEREREACSVVEWIWTTCLVSCRDLIDLTTRAAMVGRLAERFQSTIVGGVSADALWSKTREEPTIVQVIDP